MIVLCKLVVFDFELFLVEAQARDLRDVFIIGDKLFKEDTNVVRYDGIEIRNSLSSNL
jgi:hypothetical protein